MGWRGDYSRETYFTCERLYGRSWESTVNGVSAIWFGKTSWRGFYCSFHSLTLGCESGIPFLITDKSMTASSQKEVCSGDHGVFGEDRFWCSEEEKTSYLEIRFPMKYKIIGARIQLLRKYKIKDIILKIQIFDQWINIHYVKVMKQVTSTTCTVVSTITSEILARSLLSFHWYNSCDVDATSEGLWGNSCYRSYKLCQFSMRLSTINFVITLSNDRRKNNGR